MGPTQGRVRMRASKQPLFTVYEIVAILAFLVAAIAVMSLKLVY